MTDLYKPSTRNTLKMKNVICNNLISTGYCKYGVFCRQKHFPELMINVNTPIDVPCNNLNLSPIDISFNWKFDKNRNMDKEALSMIVNCYNNVSSNQINSIDDNQYMFNNITKKRRLPIFCELSKKI